MDINREIAMKMWRDIFGDVDWAQDCYGTWICRSDYGDRETVRNNRPGGTGKTYSYGWDLDHIKPISQFKNEKDANFYNNLEPTHYINNVQKSNDLTYTINNVKYRVVECEIQKVMELKGFLMGNGLIGNLFKINYIYEK